MLRVLFVDDEPNVLQGLQRMLRGMRHEWEMDFAEGGAAALKKLEAAPVDVLVSDMRMPGMSGAELLHVVQERFPGTVRIILSGHAEESMILSTVGPTHQFLSKPCDAEMLRNSIARAGALRAVLAGDQVRVWATRVKTLPSLPALYRKVVSEVQSPEGTAKSVGAIIAKDIGMSARILQLMNSAFFGMKRHVGTVQEAVALLGLGKIQSLVLAGGAFAEFDPNRCPGVSIERIWEHSLRVSGGVRAVAGVEPCSQVMKDEAGTAALLHEVGVVLLASSGEVDYRQVNDLVNREGVSIREAERRVYGCCHDEAGAYLLGLWGLSDPIVEAVAYHHRPSECVNRAFSPLTLLHAVDALVEQGEAAEADLDRTYLDRVGVSEKVPAWKSACDESTVKEEES